MSNAIFGEKKNGVHYTNRYGVYAVIPDEKLEKIVLVQAPNGAWFLPGGEIEEGENHLSALERELIEELGFTAKIGQYFGQADEYFYSNYRQTYYYNPGYFYVANGWQQMAEPTEKTNTIWWVAPQEAIEKLKRGSHKWAVEKWLLNN